MRRWVCNLAAAVCLLLCACTVVLWVRSYPHLEGISYCFIKASGGRPSSGVDVVSFESSRGLLSVMTTPSYQLDRSHDPGWSAYRYTDEYLIRQHIFGFAYLHEPGPHG